MEKENDRYVFGYESALNRMHRIIKWLIVVIIILIVALVGTNVAWIVYESQFAVESTQTEIEAWQEGDTNLVSGGDMYYGTEGQNQNDNDKTN